MIEVWHTATELAQWMTLMTIPLTILWWNNVPSIAHVGITVLLKASRWIAILVLAHESRLSLIAWAMVFAVCTKALGVYSNEWQSVFILFGALVALHRVWIVFPTSSLGTYLILAFSLLPFWALGMRTNFARTPKPDVYMFQLSSTGPHHPIYELHEAAKARFEETQERQSRSLSGAVTEYRRRYRRAPPPGFSQWYEFVIENKVQWIDEYDFMTKSLDPFWEMPPHVLREYVDQVSSLPGEARFNTLEIKNHQLSLSNGNLHQHSEVQRLLEPVLNLLPDVKAVLNEPDEPRVLVPYSELHGEFNHYESTNAHTQPVYFGRQEWQIIWDSVTLPCSPESPARAAVLDSKEESFMPPFISNLTKSQDICSMPATAGALHGFLSSPSTFSYTQRLVPIMSTSKISTFQDIIMPSSAYFQGSFAGYDESKDVPWEQKKDAVYWRGSNTGGHWTQGSWRMGHRQRFVNFTNSPGAEIRLLKETTEGKWMAYKSKMSEQQEKFNAKFTGFIQCDDEDCKGQEDYFHKADRDKNEVANQYKILYNVDGNSFSGRYYRFLKSRCLVFQQELFKEWHDDRLIPWLHFVPIGLSMEELPETTRYLLDDPEGKVIAASIASDSHDWSRKVLREVDATAAYYRVFLEYARLLDDDRDALS
ncbi:glycosyltransferase family 90 protein [Stipitochalara longipes BDJ]|nr:glycosyltransferase family 90 protein [Stipitochalara longipes BDJ]